MKKSGALIFLAIILAVVSTYFLYRYIESLRVVPEVQIKYGEVVVAVENIPQHIKITEDMLKVVSVPEEAIHPDAARKTTEIVGLTTKMELMVNEPILKSKIAVADEKTGLSYLIPENMRAIVVPTSEVNGLAGYLVKGDKVDILVTYTDRPKPAEPEATPAPVDATAETAQATQVQNVETLTQLQNIEVLEIGVKEIIDETGKAVKSQGVPSSVTLLVTPQQAEVVSFMLNNGTFQLTLRNPVDGTIVPLDHYGFDNFDDWRNR